MNLNHLKGIELNMPIVSDLRYFWLQNDIDNRLEFMRFEIMPMFPNYKFRSRMNYFNTFMLLYYMEFCLEYLNPNTDGVYVELRLVDVLMGFGGYNGSGNGDFKNRSHRAYMRLGKMGYELIEMGLAESTYKFHRRVGMHDIARRCFRPTEKGLILISKLKRKLESLKEVDLLSSMQFKHSLGKYFLRSQQIGLKHEKKVKLFENRSVGLKKPEY